MCRRPRSTVNRKQMPRVAFAVTLLLVVVPVLGSPQDTPDTGSRIEFRGLTHKELVRVIFANERKTLDQLAGQQPILETYLQSFASSGVPAIPLGDAYFLGTVDFTHDLTASFSVRRGVQSFWFGLKKSSRRVAVPYGRHLKLNPDGFLDMSFVDMEDFDADTYDLTYRGLETIAGTPSLVFSVVPADAQAAGRFQGEIWVETAGLKIIRIRGTFSPTAVSIRSQWYFHFDAYRQMVSPGVWLPAAVYFTANGHEKNGLPNLRIAGCSFIWGYKGGFVAQASMPTELSSLRDNRLLATPGPVEGKLDKIIDEISQRNHLPELQIHCRVLLTTPLELFNLGHTVIVSRGLLDAVPNDSVLEGLLTHQLAHILLEMPRTSLGSLWRNILLELPPGTDVNHPDTWDNPTQEIAARSLTLKLLNPADAPEQVEQANDFLFRLTEQSTPNLVHARFGVSLVNHQPIVPAAKSSRAQESHPLLLNPVQLRNDYRIELQNGRVEKISQETRQNILQACATYKPENCSDALRP